MEAQRFDNLTRTLAKGLTRRRLILGMSSGIGALLGGEPVAAAPRCKRVDQACKTTADCCPDENGTYCAGDKNKTCQPCAGTICKGGCTICPPTEIADPTLNCACVCRPGLTRCNGVCVDTLSDATNCGICGRPCDDGDVCTTDACVVGQCSNFEIANCCQGDLECADGDPCTTNTCVANQCQSAPVICPGADLCTGASCSPNLGCFTFPLCNDGDDCTEDTCDPVTGACSYSPLSGNPCTVPETGESGTCVNGVCDPRSCPAGQDLCNPVFCDVANGCLCTAVFGSGEPFCAGPLLACIPCAGDPAVCIEALGPGAACVVNSCCPNLDDSTCALPC
jgi:hypothetical protein